MASNNNDVEKRLWEAADQFRANADLMPSEYSRPVLGLLFLRYAETMYAQAEERVGKIGTGDRRKIGKEDYQAEGVIFLPEAARFSDTERNGYPTIGLLLASNLATHRLDTPSRPR